MAALLSLMTIAPALAECIYPKKPDDPPNGAKATKEEMITAMKATRQFDADVKAYQACLDMETETILNSLGDKATPEEIKRVKDKQSLKATAAYEDAARVAEAFNAQLRAFKSK
ncbi:MAG: hypothetical protein AB7I12_08955 [Steroidobacteraceae bacterium]